MNLPLRVRRSLGGLVCTLLVACGGDGPTGPGEDTGTTTPPTELSISSTNVGSLEMVNVGVRGVTLPQTVPGKLGSVAVTGVRLDDTTLTVILPPAAAGEHVLSFTIGGRQFTRKVQLTAAPTVADPAAYFDQVFASLTKQADSVDARLAEATPQTPASDTAGLAAIGAKLRWAADSGRKLVAAMPAAERATAAAYLQANLAAVTEPPLPAGPSFAVAPGCDGGTVAQCNAALRAAWEKLQQKIASCTMSAVKFGVGVGAVGAVLGAGVVSPLTMALGAVVGTTVAGAMCVYEINDDAMQNITVPVVVNLTQDITGAAPNEVPEAESYRVDSTSRVRVTGEVRSLVASDVNLGGIEGTIARSISQCASLWEVLMQKTGFSRPGPRLPATPARRVPMELTASMLKVGTISLDGATATTSGGDSLFRVTFHNDKQGADHPFSYVVRYEPAGRQAQERTLGGVLRPKVYRVATLKVDSAPPQLTVNQTRQLYWQASDTAGRVMPDSILAGRKPVWTSSATAVATVSEGGLITARDTGVVTISAELEGGKASFSFRVYPSVVGLWKVYLWNGKAVPFSEDDSTGTSTVFGGSIDIRADGTFSYANSESYRNKYTGIVYDEGSSGSGTYIANGAGIIFKILESSDDKIQEFVGANIIDGKLTLSYSGPEGGATVWLRR